jgi:NAD(P)-dependent dehydrogenase (short-subunit alcohol dehydrogenase family)
MSSPITDFTDRVVVITGGASGIGRALADEFAAAGSRLVLADVEKGRLDNAVAEVAASHGTQAIGVVTDVSDPESVEALAAETYQVFGATHVLVNNAGVGAPSAKVWETTPNDWRWVHSVNVFGVAYGIQAFLPRMVASGEPGYVVNTSSGDGAVNPLPGASVYAASKAAVSTITECLATQLEADGLPIGASLFLPAGGLLDTGLWTADRNRPIDLERERPRTTPAITVATLIEMSKKSGHEMRVQPLDELARVVLDGIRAGTYCITIGLDEAAATLADRAARFGAGRCPTITHGELSV